MASRASGHPKFLLDAESEPISNSMRQTAAGASMPTLVEDEEKFLQYAGSASECRVVKRGDRVKIKLRTPRRLFVHATSSDKAKALLEKIKVKKVEV